jgi:hypothetical protein
LSSMPANSTSGNSPCHRRPSASSTHSDLCTARSQIRPAPTDFYARPLSGISRLHEISMYSAP